MEAHLKRRLASNEEGFIDSKKPKREACPHGEKCYRKNPHHFKEYDHPHLTKLLDQNESPIPSTFPQDQSVYLEQLAILKPLVCPSKPSTQPGGMLAKLNATNPYNIFFSVIPESPQTLHQYNSITFADLLCPTLGKLQSSLQINFMIDIGWLMVQYEKRNLHRKPMTILYGDNVSFPGMAEYIENSLPNVTQHFVKLKDPFGCHHSKIGIYLYEDGSLRVVVSTANLYFEDWNNYNQSLWVSPLCKQSDKDDGESPTGFKHSLVEYLRHYRLPCLDFWIDAVRSSDFGGVKVALVTSVPGKHFPTDGTSHLYRTADLLSRHCRSCPADWSVIAQSSSLGSFGKSPNDWLCSTFLSSCLAKADASSPKLCIIFPTVANVLSGYFGRDSGGCLPYSKALNEKQKWLQTYLCQWRADGLYRSRAMPHIKTYCRVSPGFDKLAWFLLSSANLSKSAWGGNVQKNRSVYVRSYEAGVMFLPKFFDEEYFEIASNQNSNTRLPFLYDFPLTSYGADDYPWCI